MPALTPPAIPLLEIEREELSPEDGTRKFLWRLHDGYTIESVLIPRGLALSLSTPETRVVQVGPPARSRLTLCVSSQVGCAMACDFCLTGKQGLTRNLSVNEILGQFESLIARGFPVTHIVFMGMGEPLHNLDAVIQACRWLLQYRQFSRRRITLSTSGLVSAIDQLSRELPVRLAISLNGSNNEQRAAVMPINRKWNVETVIEAAERYAQKSRQTVMIEYVLLAGQNDDLESARRLLNLVQGKNLKVNLIPFNENPYSPYKRPDRETVKAFQHALVSSGVTTTVRKSGGRTISAACGQLSSGALNVVSATTPRPLTSNPAS